MTDQQADALLIETCGLAGEFVGEGCMADRPHCWPHPDRLRIHIPASPPHLRHVWLCCLAIMVLLFR